MTMRRSGNCGWRALSDRSNLEFRKAESHSFLARVSPRGLSAVLDTSLRPEALRQRADFLVWIVSIRESASFSTEARAKSSCFACLTGDREFRDGTEARGMREKIDKGIGKMGWCRFRPDSGQQKVHDS